MAAWCTLCLKKIVEKNMEKKIQFTHLYGVEDNVYLYAVFLLTLSPGVDAELLEGVEE